MTMTDVFTALGAAISIACMLAGSAHVLLHYRRPATAVSWLFALWIFPVLGLLAYLALSVYDGPRSLRQRRARSRLVRRRTSSDGPPDEVSSDSLASDHFATFMRRTTSLCLLPGNSATLLVESSEAFDDVINTMRTATQRIWLQTFILRREPPVEPLFEALKERARAGCDVRVLYDAIGSSKLKSRVVRDLRDAGVKAESFLPPNPLRGRFQVNFRNHRKNLIVDDIAWVGGRNWSSQDYGPTASSDRVVRLSGPILGSLERLFLEDWAVAGDDHELEEHIEKERQPTGAQAIRLIPSGCDEPLDSFANILLAALRAARSSVFISTPYMVPGPAVLGALQLAAQGGLKVTLILPETSPEKTVAWAARRFFPRLLEAGVEIYLRAPPFIHAKAIIIDDAWSSVGSSNLDYRSLYLNYEMNLEIPGRTFARELRASFDADLEASRAVQLADVRKRPVWQRVMENGAALFEPLL